MFLVFLFLRFIQLKGKKRLQTDKNRIVQTHVFVWNSANRKYCLYIVIYMCAKYTIIYGYDNVNYVKIARIHGHYCMSFADHEYYDALWTSCTLFLIPSIDLSVICTCTKYTLNWWKEKPSGSIAITEPLTKTVQLNSLVGGR